MLIFIYYLIFLSVLPTWCKCVRWRGHRLCTSQLIFPNLDNSKCIIFWSLPLSCWIGCMFWDVVKHDIFIFLVKAWRFCGKKNLQFGTVHNSANLRIEVSFCYSTDIEHYGRLLTQPMLARTPDSSFNVAAGLFTSYLTILLLSH